MYYYSFLLYQVEESSSKVQSLHSQAEIVLSGLNEDNILAEQQKSESLMNELNSVRVFCFFLHTLLGRDSQTSPVYV